MGGICSTKAAGNRSPSELSFRAIAFVEKELKPFSHGKLQTKHKTAPLEEAIDQSDDPSSRSYEKRPVSRENPQAGASITKDKNLSRILSDKLKAPKSKQSSAGKSGTTKGSEGSSLFGRASTTGFGKAVEVLDTLGSSMANLNASSGFTSGTTSKGNKITILAFEIANTIVKGANLMQCLSKENMEYLKEVVLLSEGVQRLVSSDADELLRIAAADKRQELLVLSGEVIRFGNRCKDPQWHNLDRYFASLESETTPQKLLKETATAEMQHLMMLVQNTAELYHEMQALDRFEQDYRRKLKEEEHSDVFQRGVTLQIIKQELKCQRNLVKSLRRKSLWSKTLEDVVEKFVDIVLFLHSEMHNAFGDSDGDKSVNGYSDKNQKLGPAGLALHYANIISQIDILVTRSSYVPPSARDTLYQGLPLSVKLALPAKLLTPSASPELTIPQIRSAMERTLQWLVPIANNTMRAHHGSGRVGEWANMGAEQSCKTVAGPADVINIETLYHADKDKTEELILDLVVRLHYLVSHSRPGNGAGSWSPGKPPTHSPPRKRSAAVSLASTWPGATQASILTKEDRAPRKSRSQELDTATTSRPGKPGRLTKSSSHDPMARTLVDPVVGLDIDRIEDLDAIDGAEILRKL